MDVVGMLSMVFAGVGAWAGRQAMRMAPPGPLYRMAAWATIVCLTLIITPIVSMVLGLIQHVIGGALQLGV